MTQRPFTMALALAAAAWALLLPRAMAATTDVVRDDSFRSLQEGELEEMAISSDGYLYPSYARQTVGDTGAEIVWAVLPRRRGGTLCATGHEGKLIRLSDRGEAQTLADLPEPELTAMAALPDGTVAIAAAPTGRIYLLGDDDQLTTLTQIEAKFIWDLEVDADGALWAATGTEGKLYKITRRRGAVDVKVAATLASHNLIDVWIDREGRFGDRGRLYVAGQNPAWLYRYRDGDASATPVHSAAGDEIRAILPTPEGLVLAVNTDRAPSPQALQLTLRLSGAAPTGGSGAGEGPGQQGSGVNLSDREMGDVFAVAQRPPAQPTSTLDLLTADGFSRTLWTSPERPIHALALSPKGEILAAAGGKGRLFEVGTGERFALVADLKEDYIVRIAETEGGWLLAGARNGVVARMETQRARKAVYVSRVIDAKAPAGWGRFYARGEWTRDQRVLVAFRKGNADDPDKGGWAQWSRDETLNRDSGLSVGGDPARYLQYRVTLEQGRLQDPLLRLDYLEVFYQLPNRAPQISRVEVTSAGRRGASPPGSGAPPARTPTPSGPPQAGRPPTAPGGPPPRSEPGDEAEAGGRQAYSNTGSIEVTWTAEDPNGDELVYSLFYRADDETEWKLIDDEIRATRLPLEVTGVGDGRYRFRVVARDEFANPPGRGLEAELTSDEYVVDNTPPRLENLRVRPSGDRARLTCRIVDDLSLVSSIKVDLDGGDAYPIFPEDGFLDAREETVDWTTPALQPGEHVLTIAVTDRAGNTAVAKVVFVLRP